MNFFFQDIKKAYKSKNYKKAELLLFKLVTSLEWRKLKRNQKRRFVPILLSFIFINNHNKFHYFFKLKPKDPEKDVCLLGLIDQKLYNLKDKKAFTKYFKKYLNWFKDYMPISHLLSTHYESLLLPDKAERCYEKFLSSNEIHYKNYVNTFCYYFFLFKYKKFEKLDKINIYKHEKDFLYFITDDSSHECLYNLERQYARIKKDLPAFEKFSLKFFGKENVNDSIIPKKIIADEGIGDTIMNMRYLPFIKRYHTEIDIYTNPVKNSLFTNEIFPNLDNLKINIINHNPNKNTEYTSFELLNYYVKQDKDFNKITGSKGYLTPQQDKKEKFKNLLKNTEKLNIGITYSSTNARTLLADDLCYLKNLPVKYVKKLVKDFRNINFYPIELPNAFEKVNAKNFIDVTENFKDLADTLAFIANLDLIVTIDTSIVHLAGAAGLNTILLLHYCSDSRWFEDTDTTPWYDSVRIIKQPDFNNWNYVYKELKKRIKLLEKKHQ